MEVRLPKLGEGAESGTVVSVFVKEGDRISKGQILLELENEKAVAPIPAAAAGRVTQVRVKEGDKISVGQVLLTLEEAGGGPAPAAKPERAAAAAAAVPETAAPSPAAPPVAETEMVAGAAPVEPAEELPGVPPPASPTIRKIARELEIDLRRIQGSESGGRIVMADLRAYVKGLERLAAQPKAAPPARLAAPAPAPAAERIDFSKWGPVKKKPMSPLRQTISQRLTLSWNTIPHVTQFDEADLTAINELRQRLAPAYKEKGVHLTVTAFVLQAVAATLKKHPLFNASLDEAARELVFKEYYHLGLAVDTDQGLIVPVIRDVDQKDLLQLSQEIRELADKARARKLTREELQGGTFTISNQGGIGGAHFTPIINKPEVAVLGLGRAALKPVFQAGQLEPRLLVPLGLSYDHRVIDGGSAARFIVDLVQALETSHPPL
jgi:pyruvate dehydrogenase E2 component (dihydrolipoamide acetyltransferase)